MSSKKSVCFDNQEYYENHIRMKVNQMKDMIDDLKQNGVEVVTRDLYQMKMNKEDGLKLTGSNEFPAVNRKAIKDNDTLIVDYGEVKGLFTKKAPLDNLFDEIEKTVLGTDIIILTYDLNSATVTSGKGLLLSLIFQKPCALISLSDARKVTFGKLGYFLKCIEISKSKYVLWIWKDESGDDDVQLVSSLILSAVTSDYSKYAILVTPKGYPSISDKLHQIDRWMSGDFTGLQHNPKKMIQTLQTKTGEHTNWLDDEAINAYMQLLSKHYPNVFVFDSFFWPMLKEHGYEGVKKWYKKVFIFDRQNVTDTILVPINVNNNHWTLAAIHLNDAKIQYFDSLNANANPFTVSNLFCNLNRYVKNRFYDEMGFILDVEQYWQNENVLDIPQQTNTTDCGVFICMYAELIARKKPIQNAFSQKHMVYFRKKMVYELCTNSTLF